MATENNELLLELELDLLRTRKLTAHLDERDVARVEAAVNNTRTEASLASGPLIDWFAVNVAGFDQIQHFADDLVRPTCVHVPWHVLERALSDWSRVDSPAANYTVLPTNGWCKDNNLETLQQAGLLSTIDAWKRISFVLNGDGHWSVLMLVRAEQVALLHYDTLFPAHSKLARLVCRFLCAAGLVDPETVVQRDAAVVQQSDTWSCGYGVMARLYEHGTCTFWPDTCSGYLSRSADEIANGQLTKFLYFIKQRNDAAVVADKLLTRYRRIYL
jgi:hypothetical protein